MEAVSTATGSEISGWDRWGSEFSLKIAQGMRPAPVTHVVAVDCRREGLAIHTYRQPYSELRSNANQEARLRREE
jgi:hypothetical protein